MSFCFDKPASYIREGEHGWSAQGETISELETVRVTRMEVVQNTDGDPPVGLGRRGVVRAGAADGCGDIWVGECGPEKATGKGE